MLVICVALFRAGISWRIRRNTTSPVATPAKKTTEARIVRRMPISFARPIVATPVRRSNKFRNRMIAMTLPRPAMSSQVMRRS